MRPGAAISRAKRQLTEFRLRTGPDTLDAAITCEEHINLSGGVLGIDSNLLNLLHAQRATQTRMNPVVV
jgi:hypothetical protein